MVSAVYSQKRRSGHGDYSKLRVYCNTSTTGKCTYSFTIRTRRDDIVYEPHNTFGTMAKTGSGRRPPVRVTNDNTTRKRCVTREYNIVATHLP